MINNDVSEIKIKDTGLSYRAYIALARAGLLTVGEVTELTDQQLLEIDKLGVKTLAEIRKEFDSERLLGTLERNIAHAADYIDCIFNVGEFSVRTRNALVRAGISTLAELRQATDYRLSNIRNLGAKAIAEIDSVIPDRIKTYEGEAEEIAERCMKRKVEIEAKRIMRDMESKNMTLSELLPTYYRSRRARDVLTEYCSIFPERIPDVLHHFEVINDTADKFYIRLKQSNQQKP